MRNMIKVNKYISLLIKRAKEELKNSYDYSGIQFNDFELINSFLIDRVLNKDEYSLFNKNPRKRDASGFLPACNSFNCIDSIFQKLCG